MVVKANFKHFTFVFMNMYVPANATDRVLFLQVLSTALSNRDAGEVVIALKMNCWTEIT